MIATWKLPTSKVYHGLNNALGLCVHKKHYQVLPTQMVPISALAHGLYDVIITRIDRKKIGINWPVTWWRHYMKPLSVTLVHCPPITGGFPWQRASNSGLDVFFEVGLNKRLSKHSNCRWFETPLGSLWRHFNVHTYKSRVCYIESSIQKLMEPNVWIFRYYKWYCVSVIRSISAVS